MAPFTVPLKTEWCNNDLFSFCFAVLKIIGILVFQLVDVGVVYFGNTLE